MGRPFDPKTGRVLDTSPEIYDPTRYLTAMHVHNTIQAIAGIPKVKRVLYGRGLPPAPEIETVIAG